MGMTLDSLNDVNGLDDSSSLLVNLACLINRPTGISTYALNLLPFLTSLQPLLLTNKNFSDFKCYKIPEKLTPEFGIQGRLKRFYWTQFQLPNLYQKRQAQLLFSPLPEAPVDDTTRFIVTVHDFSPLRFPKRLGPRTFYFRHWVPRVLNRAKHIICDAHSTAQELHDFWGMESQKISVIPLAYDCQNFRLYPDKEPPKVKYFLYVGHSEPYKNLSRLIQAFAKIYSQSEHQLWIAGASEHRYTPLLQKQAQSLGVAAAVKFLDYVSYKQLPSLMNQATALVFPSLWEGFGLPALEAMACGTPVITSNLASLPEVVGDAAILINPYQVDEIADAMKQIAVDGQLRSQLRQAGLDRVKQFSWEKTGQATVEVLQRFL